MKIGSILVLTAASGKLPPEAAVKDDNVIINKPAAVQNNNIVL